MELLTRQSIVSRALTQLLLLNQVLFYVFFNNFPLLMVPSGALLVHGLSVFVTSLFGSSFHGQNHRKDEALAVSCHFVEPYECQLRKIHETRSKLEPSEPVLSLTFDQSNLQILTRNFCDAFPSLKTFNGDFLEIKFIKSDAFEGCPGLQEISLRGNNLSHIDSTLFSKNFILKKVDLRQNPMLSLNFNHIHLSYSIIIDPSQYRRNVLVITKYSKNIIIRR